MIKLKEAKYYKEDGYSSAIIETDLGNFMGHAFLHPEDESIASSFIGCEIAEARATICYYKKKLKIVNIELNILKRLDNKLGFELNEVKKEIKQKEQLKEQYKFIIKSIKENIDKRLDKRVSLLDKVSKKKENKEEDE